MSEGGARRGRRRAILDWRGALGFVLSLGLLYWAFRDIRPREVLDHVLEADPVLLSLAVIGGTLMYVIRAFRWKPLLAPAYPDSRLRPRFAAVAVGFMANNLLPARMGEFLRAYSLSRLEPVRMAASFGSLVVERMLDGLIIVAMLLGSMAWPGFPGLEGRNFQGLALAVGALFAAVFVALLVMVVQPRRSVDLFERAVNRFLPRSIRRPIVSALESFLGGVSAVRDPGLMIRVLLWTLVLWSTQAIAFWLGFLAFDIHVPLVAGFFLQSLVALAVALPSAPGFFGVFEAGARVGLVEVWGVESSRAVAFAVGYHVATFVPITLMGLYYVWRLGLTWGEVQGSEEAVESAVEQRERAGEPTS